jgi:probable rRNA maturation factor
MRLRLDVVRGDDAADELGEPIDCDALASVLGVFAQALAAGGRRELSIALSFVTPQRIRELNAAYRGVDEETDVLSFPLWETDGAFSPPDGWEDLPLGDVVVSAGYVFQSCLSRNIDYNDEIIITIIHGALHLVGFDHDTEERERVMWREQEALAENYKRMKSSEEKTRMDGGVLRGGERGAEILRGGLMEE